MTLQREEETSPAARTISQDGPPDAHRTGATGLLCSSCKQRLVGQDKAQRFWSRVEKGPHCWIWNGPISRGYGIFYVSGSPKRIRAHRFSWSLENGPIPPGMLVLHTCDVSACVNPRHLYLGTDADNMRDSMARGRHRFGSQVGEKNSSAFFTDSIVRELRRRHSTERISCAELSRQYGTSPKTIWKIINRKTWRHVPESTSLPLVTEL